MGDGVAGALREAVGEASKQSIRDSTHNALAFADELGCESVVFPALACGIAGVDLETGAPYIFEEILSFNS